MHDEVNRNDHALAANIGQVVILPATYVGGPRYMHGKGQDGLTYVRYYGRPDLFITFTCNSNWHEIKSNLLDDKQKPNHRHDITARVFKLKLKKMMDLIVRGQLYGPVKCFLYTIEWQKRGLPHAHILIWLENKI